MILLDTCTLLWLVNNRRELSRDARHAIDTAGQVYVSAASAFEIGTKHRQGRLTLALPPQAWWRAAVDRLELAELAITPVLAIASAALPTELTIGGRPLEHRDPGDRFLVATAAQHDLTIVTPDPLIAAYPGVSVLW
jgi:PIN domain nuclease of toxin-antitoxin system